RRVGLVLGQRAEVGQRYRNTPGIAHLALESQAFLVRLLRADPVAALAGQGAEVVQCRRHGRLRSKSACELEAFSYETGGSVVLPTSVGQPPSPVENCRAGLSQRFLHLVGWLRDDRLQQVHAFAEMPMPPPESPQCAGQAEAQLD